MFALQFRSKARLSAALLMAALAGPQGAMAQAGASTAQTSTPPADTESLTVARSIVATLFPPERRDAMIDKVMIAILGQMGTGMQLDAVTDPGLKKILTDYLDGVPQMLRPATAAFLPRQMEAMAQAYTRAFPLAELKDIAAFARTQSGRDYLQRSTELLSDPGIAAVNAAYFQQAGAISKQGEAELRAKIEAYIKAHPQAVPSAQSGNKAR